MFAWRRFTLPLPVSLKRFAALLFVFIFGMYSLRSSPPTFRGAKIMVIVRASIIGADSILPMSSHHLRHPRQNFTPQLRVRRLPTPEHHRHLHLVALFEEPPRVPHLELEVVRLDPRTQLHFLHLDLVLLLARLPRLARLLVLELAVVHDPDDRRPRRRRDLHQIQTFRFRPRQRLLDRHDSQLLAFRANDSDRADPDLPVDSYSLVC